MNGAKVDKVAELRAATREANEVLKDLHRVVAEGKILVKGIDAAAEVAVLTRMEPVVKEGLQQYAGALKQAIEDATAAVDRRFDQLADIMLGEDKTARRRGKPSIPELIERRNEGRPLS